MEEASGHSHSLHSSGGGWLSSAPMAIPAIGGLFLLPVSGPSRVSLIPANPQVWSP